MSETIVALATAPGSQQAIVRLSGPASLPLVAPIDPGAEGRRGASEGWLRTDPARPPLPVVCYRMPGPRSFTGEDVVELHLPGGLAVERLLDWLLAQPGLRAAEAGEFTRRAFEAGRLDPLEVEALLAMVTASDEAQARAAAAGLAGGLRAVVARLEGDLLAAAGLLEASLDFADRDLDDDLGVSIEGQAAEALERLLARLRQAAGEQGAAAPERPRLLLYGAPNAGKSTLFNALLGRERAVVAPVPGTTRDPVVAQLQIAGQPCDLIDPAGVGEVQGALDAAAQARAAELLASADLVLQLVPADAEPPAPLPRGLRVRSKSDLAAGPEHAGDDLAISAASGAGLDALREAIAAALRARPQGSQGLSSARVRNALRAAIPPVEAALALLAEGGQGELAAFELADAREALALLTGQLSDEQILGEIFGRFCVGK